MLYPLYSSPDIARNVLEPIGTQKRSGVDTVWPSLKLVDWALPRKARFDVPFKSVFSSPQLELLKIGE
jgi:hypothetical protein